MYPGQHYFSEGQAAEICHIYQHTEMPHKHTKDTPVE
jgi:hypothetical protein